MQQASIPLFAIFMLLFSSISLAGDASNGEKLYTNKGCLGCHGPAGNSPNPAVFPKTSGLEAEYLVEQMVAFRDGVRKNPVMSPMAVGLSDTDIADLAAYLSAQK